MINHYQKKIEEHLKEIADIERVLKLGCTPNYEDFLNSDEQLFFVRFKKKNLNSWDESKLNVECFDGTKWNKSIRERSKLVIRYKNGYFVYFLWGILSVLLIVLKNEFSILNSIACIGVAYFLAAILSLMLDPIVSLLDEKLFRLNSWNRYYLLEKKEREFQKAIQLYDAKFIENKNLLSELKESLTWYQKELEKSIKQEEEKEEQIRFERKRSEEEEEKIRKMRLEQKYWLRLNGYEFEDAVCKLYKDNGFDVSPTSYTNDGGADLIIKDKDDNVTIIQCKNFSNPVSPSVARDLLGTIIDFDATNGILVCSGGFTSGTIDFANRNGIELVDGSDLIEMSKQFNADLLSK
jgi:hypothetical protein